MDATPPGNIARKVAVRLPCTAATAHEPSNLEGPVRLIVIIPAYNEAEDIGRTIASVPRSVAGFTTVEVVVIDDGSTDGTDRIARDAGADHVVRHRRNRGLAATFRTGLETALERGADVIVNLDADGQYDSRDLPALVQPILDDRADVVVGARPIEEMRHFSWLKRRLQRVGSAVVRLASGIAVDDATSGFRALSADAARRIAIYSTHTYTLESLIQAGSSGIDVVSVPVRVNGPTRPSRLMRSWPQYVRRSAVTIVRMFVVYRPFRFFGTVSLAFTLAGTFLIGRFLVYLLTSGGQGRVQSLVIGGALLTVGVQILMTAFLADAVAMNRRILEQLRHESRRRPSGRGA